MEIKCDYCGKLFNYKECLAHFKRVKTHYCSRSCQGNGNNIKQGNKLHGLAIKKNGKADKRYRVWCCIKKRAKERGVDFNLQIEDIPEIPKVCPVLKIKIKENTKSAPLDSSPSLDRINPKLGYIRGNVRFISNRANRIKSDATLEELKLVLKDSEKIWKNLK